MWQKIGKTWPYNILYFKIANGEVVTLISCSLVNVSKCAFSLQLLRFLLSYIYLTPSFVLVFLLSFCFNTEVTENQFLSSHPQHLWLTLLILCTFHKPIQNKLLLSSWMHIPLYFNEKNTNRNHVIESKY